MSYLLDIVYIFALILYSPVILFRSIVHGRYRRGRLQRLGFAPRRHGLQPVVWIHGVSVGEVNAAKPLVDEINRQLPDYRVVISTTTDTGMDTAKRLYSPRHTVFCWPLDFTCSVRAALNRIQPDIVVMMEGEIWPNFLAECNRRSIPVMVANGRMSPNKGYPRYKKLGSLASKMFNRLSAIGVQDEIYAEKFIKLGMDPAKVHLTGMLKFETITIADKVDGQDQLASALGLRPEEKLLVAGGTGNGEEALVLQAWEKVKQSHPDLRLAIVPRKPERFEEVAGLITSGGHELIRRSQRPDGTEEVSPSRSVILGDTMGDLKKFYALATVAFIGRSLVPMGGSDMIESAALATPTCFGPHTFNFPQAEGMLSHGCRQVADVEALADCVNTWLDHPETALEDAQKSQKYVQKQKGAAKRNTALICRLLGRREPLSDGGISTEMIEESQ